MSAIRMRQFYGSDLLGAIPPHIGVAVQSAYISLYPFRGVVVPRSRKNLCVALLLLAACAGGPATQASTEGGGPNTSASAVNRNSNVVTREELSDPTLAGNDMLQVLRRIRPQYLVTRGMVSKSNTAAGAVQVSMDGGALQPLSTLNSVRVEEVLEVRYFTSSEAAQKFGSTANSGPVLVVKRR